MASIHLQGLAKQFGSVVAVNNLNLELAEGELIAFLGPSGCGKTTTLRMIAGFEAADAGRILLGGRDVTSLPPEQRDTGMVFQNYALFPHLTVHENVAFGLKMRKRPKREIKERVIAILNKVQLTDLGHRYPRQLSGGQQQRTALARALVINPTVLLLDEPLANLDAKLREEMRFYIRQLQQEVSITTIYVTHDQAEALVLADRIAVMRSGILQQIGTPEEIYARPRNAWVAGFVGLTNLVPGVLQERANGAVVVETAVGQIQSTASDNLPSGAKVLLSVRPESLQLSLANEVSTATSEVTGTAPGFAQNRLSGTVSHRAYLGNLVDYRVEVTPELLLRVQSAPTPAYEVGECVTVSFAPDQAWLVQAEGGADDGDDSTAHRDD